MPVVPWHPQILADQLTLSQPGGADYAHHINTGIPGFSDLPKDLTSEQVCFTFCLPSVIEDILLIKDILESQ